MSAFWQLISQLIWKGHTHPCNVYIVTESFGMSQQRPYTLFIFKVIASERHSGQAVKYCCIL